MQITFEFHGALRRLAGADELKLSVADGVSLEQALDALAEALPAVSEPLERCACALGDRLLLRRETLEDGVRIALLPPVAGG